jgi:predicted unusual protein kinase regulating ubiquinone biosynthesis (AarF/ABC1/UbiB family)/ribosomal protein L7/L12
MLPAMPNDDVRSRVAKRIAAENANLTTSALGRRARWVAGLATAGAKSLGRTIGRTVGLGDDDVGPEAAVVASLGQLKGPMMKMGQMLGYVDVGLPAGLRSALSALHTNAQPLEATRIRRVLDEDLGDPGRELGREMQPEALSAASIGQVHRSALPDGTPVVVKVVHPGLSTVIERDLWPAMLASKLSAPLRSMIQEIRERLLEECDYTLEAQRQTRFREIFAGHRTIVVPEVHRALSSGRVITSSFLDGVHLDAYLASGRATPDARNRAGEALFDFYIAPLFKHGLYNSDPHPGNYIFLPDGRVGFVDFGSVREFDPEFVAGLASLIEALMAGDRGRMHEALVALGDGQQVAYDREATWRLLHAFFGPLLRDEVLAFDVNAELSLRQLLTSAWKARRLAASGELLFLLRTFVGLSSVLARLGARANWRSRLATVIAAVPSLGERLGQRSRAARPGDIEEECPPTKGSVEPAGDGRPAQPARDGRPAQPARDGRPAQPAREAKVAQPSPVKKVEDSWDVVLVDPGPSPIALIRALRELMGRDLRELEAIVDSPPETLKRAMQRADAETLRQRLATVGARVEVRRASPPA